MIKQGNKCFDEEIRNLEWSLEDHVDLGDPPCGCYPDCNRIKYSLAARERKFDRNNEMLYRYPFSAYWYHEKTVEGCAREEIDNCTAAELFQVLQHFEDTPKDQFLSRYIFDIFLKNETQLSVQHIVHPKYRYKDFQSK